MLTLKLSPVRSDEEQYNVEWNDPVLTVDGIAHDLSELGDGDTATHETLKEVTRVSNDYTVKLVLTHGANAPEETRFPADIVVETNGIVNLPAYNEEETI